MVKERNLTKKTHNGVLKGLIRVTCNKCQESQTITVEQGPITRCPFCNTKDINVVIGNKPLTKKTNQSLKIITKINGGKLKMASKEVEAALKVLKEAGIETRVVTEDTEVADETTGDVGGEEETEESSVDEGLIVERSDVGRGMQIYRDYSKDSRFKRLCR